MKFDENGRKLSKRVKNTVGNGEIAGYEQFLLFPQCFQKACFPGASKGFIVWERVNLEQDTCHITIYPIHISCRISVQIRESSLKAAEEELKSLKSRNDDKVDK